MKRHIPGHRHRRRRSGLLFVLTILFSSVLAAPVSAATPSVLEAPPEAAQVWIDVESEAARTGVASVSWRAGGGTWTDAAVSRTVYGATATAPVSSGTYEVRFSVERRITADVAVSFTDTAGRVLSEHLVREAALDPAEANGGWVTWKDLVEGPAPDGGGEVTPVQPGGNGAEDESGPASGPVAQGSDPKALGKTGASAPFLALVLSVAAALTGTGLFLVLRGKGSTPASEGGEEQ